MSISAFQINPDNGHICIIVGLGLIGTSINNHLASNYKNIYRTLQGSTNWQDPNEIIEIIGKISRRERTNPEPANYKEYEFVKGHTLFILFSGYPERGTGWHLVGIVEEPRGQSVCPVASRECVSRGLAVASPWPACRGLPWSAPVNDVCGCIDPDQTAFWHLCNSVYSVR